MLFGIGALVFQLVKRLGGEPEEFVFTEAPIEEAPANADATASANN